MAKRTFAIRLYHFHDKDLVTLLEQYEFNITQAAYIALSFFVKKENVLISVTEKRRTPIAIKHLYIKHLILDEKIENDQRILSLLNKINPGYRNMFIKHILRCALMHPISEVFFDEANDYENTLDLCSAYKDAKRVIDLKTKKRFGKGEIEKLFHNNIESSESGADAKEMISSKKAETISSSDKKKKSVDVVIEAIKKDLEAEKLINSARAEASKQLSLLDIEISDEDGELYEEDNEVDNLNDLMNSLF